MSAVTALKILPISSGARGNDLLERGVVHVDLYGVDFIPWEPESFKFALEYTLVLGLVDSHDEAAEHVDPHLLKRGVNTLQDRSSVALKLLTGQARCAVNGHELCHADTPTVVSSSASRLR